MNMLRENMRLIAECSQQLVSLGENLWGKEQEITSIGEVNIEPLDVPTMTTDFVKEHGLPCPEGYIFKDENGNVINTTKIVLEKKSPKTDDIIKWLREHDMTKYIGVIYSGMCSITFDTEGLIKDFLKMADDDE